MSTTAVSKARTFPLVLISSSIGKKFLVAVTGFISFGYIIGHMLGNLQIFAGQNQINMYAEALHSLGPLLWVIRAVLLAAFIIHIWLGLQLKLENMAARPVNYTKQDPQKSKLSGRTMWLTGLMVLAFFVYHVLHFTARTTDARFATLALDAEGRYDVYSMVILGFQQIPLVAGLADLGQFRSHIPAQIADPVAGRTGGLGAVEDSLAAAKVPRGGLQFSEQ